MNGSEAIEPRFTKSSPRPIAVSEIKGEGSVRACAYSDLCQRSTDALGGKGSKKLIKKRSGGCGGHHLHSRSRPQ